MILVHAGNRVDAADRVDARFSAENVDVVRTRAQRLLAAMRPTGVVSAPAAGADLVVLEEAARQGIACHVVLPLPPGAFEAASVADRGEAWVRAYHRVLRHARGGGGGGTLTMCDLSGAASWSRAANGEILQRAEALAEEGGARVVALAVRPRPSRGAPSVTDDFVDRATGRGLPVISIDPRPAFHEMRSALVAVLDGNGSEGAPGAPVDADGDFDQVVVPALEGADLAWRRAGPPAAHGGHLGVDERPAEPDVVLVVAVSDDADVQGALRSLRRRAMTSTVVLARTGTRTGTAQVRGTRLVTYEVAGTAITEDEAIAAWRTLGPVLDEEARRPGSVEGPAEGPAGP